MMENMAYVYTNSSLCLEPGDWKKQHGHNENVPLAQPEQKKKDKTSERKNYIGQGRVIQEMGNGPFLLYQPSWKKLTT